MGSINMTIQSLPIQSMPIEYCDPDVILASEKWLNSTIAGREVLPANYKFVARKVGPTAVMME